MSGRENMGRIRKMEVTKGWNYKKSTYSAGGLDSKESVCIAGDLGSTPGSGRSLGERNGNPLQYSYLEKSHEQRSLVGYSPWDSEEWDTTEQLTLSLPH